MNNRELARTTCFDNMAAFVEWAAANHVERQGSRKAKPAPGGTIPAAAPK